MYRLGFLLKDECRKVLLSLYLSNIYSPEHVLGIVIIRPLQIRTNTPMRRTANKY